MLDDNPDTAIGSSSPDAQSFRVPKKPDTVLLKDMMAEAEEQIEANRLKMAGKAFEKFVLNGILKPITSYEELLKSTAEVSDALGTMKVDGQPLTYEQKYRVLYNLSLMQLKINPPITGAPVSQKDFARTYDAAIRDNTPRKEKIVIPSRSTPAGVGVGVHPVGKRLV